MLKTICCISVMFCFVFSSQAQTQAYPKVKVTMNNGTVINGKKGVINSESVTLNSAGIQNSYPLSDVLLIQAKQGKAGKWALGCGGGCLAICIISGIATGSEGLEEQGYTTGQYVAGSLIWTGVFAGVGAIIGTLSDDYQNVYMAKTSYLRERFRFDMASTQLSKYNFSLAYKFSM